VRRGKLSPLSPEEEADKQQRLKIFGENAAQLLRELKDPDVIDAFPHVRVTPVLDDRSCAYCRAKADKLIRVRDCKIDMLPPFNECTNEEDGCRCSFTPIPKWEVLDVLPGDDILEVSPVQEILVACPHCERSVRVSEGAIGKTLSCPHCKRYFTTRR
jgi:hypothetical protein